jgi:hypothetical protein
VLEVNLWLVYEGLSYYAGVFHVYKHQKHQVKTSLTLLAGEKIINERRCYIWE